MTFNFCLHVQLCTYVRYGTVHVAMLVRFTSKAHFSNSLIVDEYFTKISSIAYAYFDFRLDIREPRFIHPRCNRIVVIRLILNLHDVFTARSEKENNENTISDRTDSLRRMISLDLQQVPVADSHSLSPTAICRIRKNRRFPRIFLRLYCDGTKHLHHKRRTILTKLAVLGDAFSARCSHGRECGRETERTRRSEARTGPNCRCGPPNALRACGFRYLSWSGEDKKVSLETIRPTLKGNAE